MPFFTIFTPVFNGALTFHRVYESVINQTFRDFEWIIINDGSTDNSDKIIRELISHEHDFTIIYLQQENLGKHYAMNKAIEQSGGILFIPADADDRFVDYTLEYFYKKWLVIDPDLKKIISGISVLCFDNDGPNVVGDMFPSDGFITNVFELNFKYLINGEKWGCIRTDILRKFKFNTQKKMIYIREGYLWLRISKEYQLICFNEPLRYYYTNPEGLSLNPKRINLRQFIEDIYYQLWILYNFGYSLFKISPIKLFMLLINLLFKLPSFGYQYSKKLIQNYKNIN